MNENVSGCFFLNTMYIHADSTTNPTDRLLL